MHDHCDKPFLLVPCGDLDLLPISKSNLLPGRGQFFEFLPVEFDLALCVSSAECFYLNLVVNHHAGFICFLVTTLVQK